VVDQLHPLARLEQGLDLRRELLVGPEVRRERDLNPVLVIRQRQR
jgi:hypothetical protein